MNRLRVIEERVFDGDFMSGSWKTVGIFIVLIVVAGGAFILWQGQMTGPVDHHQTASSYETPLTAKQAQDLMDSIPAALKNLPYAIYPTSPEYNTDRFNFNKRYSVYPHAIICPRNQQEAASILTLLRKYKLEFSVRSGGHCYEPGSLSPGYIFDLRNFNSVVPNVQKEEVAIGAGCRIGDIFKNLGKLDYTIPTGLFPRVGIAGLTLGGGIGLLIRTHGLTCDSVKSMTVLTAKSEIIEVHANSYPDLFWALRGAGTGSYGIVLGFNFKMHAVPAMTYYELRWDWNKEVVAEAVKAWQTWIQTLPDTITSQVQFRYDKGKNVFNIVGFKMGTEKFTEWTDAFKDLNPREVVLFTGSYNELGKHWIPALEHPYSKMKSNIFMEPVNDDVIDKIVTLFDDAATSNLPYNLVFDFDAFGGKVATMPDTAFFPRKALAWWIHEYYWESEDQEEEALKYARTFYDEVTPMIGKYRYDNAADYDLGADYLDDYYGDKVPRLIEIKNKYDPENLFRWRLSIPLSK